MNLLGNWSYMQLYTHGEP